MASYKKRAQELEQALRGIAEICSVHVFPPGHEKNIPICHDVLKITDTVISGGTLAQSGVTKKVRNLMSGKEVEIPVGTPLHLDPSSETYWSM